jgi:hypothetical protein
MASASLDSISSSEGLGDFAEATNLHLNLNAAYKQQWQTKDYQPHFPRHPNHSVALGELRIEGKAFESCFVRRSIFAPVPHR